MQDIKKILDDIKINYRIIPHLPVYTCKEAEKYEKDIKGLKSKNLFLKSKIYDKYFLVIIPSNEKLNIRELEILLKEKLTFGRENELKEILNLSPGSVSPFGLINDINKKTTLVLSKKILETDYLSFHPNINTETLELEKNDFLRFLNFLNIAPRVF